MLLFTAFQPPAPMPPAVVAPAPDTWNALFNKSDELYLQGKQDEALQGFQQCLLLAKREGNSDHIFRSLIMLSTRQVTPGTLKIASLERANASIGYAQEGVEYVKRHLKEKYQFVNPLQWANNTLGLAYFSRGGLHLSNNPKEARTDLLTASKYLKEGLDEPDMRYGALIYIAASYIPEYGFNQAKAYLDKAQPGLDYVSGDDLGAYYTMHASIALIKGDKEGASAALNKALAIHNIHNDLRANLTTFLHIFKQLHSEKGEGKNSDSAASLSDLISNMLLNYRTSAAVQSKAQLLKNLDEAEALTNQQINLPALRAGVATMRGSLALEVKNYTEAEKHFQKAIAFHEDLSNTQSQATYAGALQAVVANLYGLHAESLVRQQRLADALVAADRGRGQGLRKLLASQTNASAQHITTNPLSAFSPERLARLGETRPDTLFMHFNMVDDDRALLLTFSKEGVQSFWIPGAAALRKQRTSWKRLLEREPALDAELKKSASAQENKRSTELYQSLFSGAEQAGLLTPGKFKRLVILPDGPLWDIPFAALLDKEGKRLIEKYPISISVSLALSPTAPPLPGAPLPLNFLADPFGKKPSSGAQVAVASKQKGVRLGNKSPLDIARAMVERIAKAERGRAYGYYGNEANRKNASSLLMREGVLLCATHGVAVQGSVSAEAGLNSYLNLADGQWKAREILEMKSNIASRLAILMACSTGVGTEAGGDGLFGLGWAFLGKGCPSVMASRWEVDEIASSSLVESFWKNLKLGSPKDEALQKAIFEIRTTKRAWSHPYYWSAFQIYGDAAPLWRP